MLIDALKLAEDTLVETDICIVGAGAAGITLARELIDQPYQVCLLESGGLDFDEQTQSLYAGENIGAEYFPLKETRARYLGGSTNLWGGWSRPLDDIDFEDRSWMPYSGWPINKAELMPYYERAQKVCNLGPREYDFAFWKDALAQVQCQELPFLTNQLATYIWQLIPPTHLRFGEVYRAEIEQARNLTTLFHANVLEIETNDTAQTVTRLRVASLDGKKFRVAAKVFILAAGGIENPRLLLVSNQTQSTGLGNQYDLVGRFFMEHPYLISGKLQLSSLAPLYTRCNFQVGETFLATGLGLSKAAQENEQILNFSARLMPLFPEWLEAFNRLRFRMRSPKTHHLQTKTPEAFPSMQEGRWWHKSEQPVWEDVLKVITNLDSIAARAYTKLFDKSFDRRQSNLYSTHLIGEQAPNPDSRITLSRERDRLGLNRVQLDWRLSPIDKYTLARSQQLIAQEFERSGLGQLQIELSDDNTCWQSVIGSYHHIGTTRMSNNPRLGVVNQDCQVHSMSNLYIAGSSVFPTSGLSNPTLTIVALSIRLADHIKERMSDSAGAIRGLAATSAILPQ